AAEAAVGKPSHFNEYRSRNDQVVRMVGQERRARFVIGVVAIQGRVERPGVADQRHGGGSNSMSPARRPVSPPPDAPAPMKLRRLAGSGFPNPQPSPAARPSRQSGIR